MNGEVFKTLCAETAAQGARLVAVSKTKPVADILELYHAGQRVFGENKVQEMADKQQLLPADIEWHFIGHLQTNKVKQLAAFVSLIHSVDSLKLLEEINKQAQKNNRVIDCLLQIFIADEVTKFGFHEDELQDLLHSNAFRELKNIRICGLMGMATNTNDTVKIENEFIALHTLFNKLRETEFKQQPAFCELSMGMSSDYKIALRHGATLIRIGSMLFGQRDSVNLL
ncbi:MAG: YggS family pyridoxal phosphate-dependent enzyme [Bacteroidetes bacterium]|nr:YggS family pyridoxal phosphate-dependent enzyme [Bacteroidota bacterium]